MVHATDQRQHHTSHKKPIWKNALLAATILLAAFALVNTIGSHRAEAAACPVPSTDNGTDTLTMNVPAAATYTLWVRMMVPNAPTNHINVQVDSSTCFNVGGGSALPANTWTWVNYQNGATATPNTIDLAAGSHTVKLIGTDAGVSVDRVLLNSSNCTPTGNGDDCASSDTTAPTVSLVAPTDGSTATGNVTLSAAASDASGIASVQFLVDGSAVNTDTSSPYSYSWNSASASNGSHTITAQATDKASNVATSSSVTVNVNNTVACTGTPSVPTGLAVTGKTMSSVSLSWNASTPAAGCTMQGYKVYRGTTLVTTVTSGTAFTDTGLTPGTTYSYKIAAVDTSGHTSANTSTVSTTTSADTAAPSTPANVHSTLITSNSIALAWNASTDNVSVTGYIVYRNGTQIGTTSTTNYTDTALSPSTTYSYTVKAKDANNNQSAASTAANIKTLDGPAPKPGDANGDGVVNITDLSILLSHWNKPATTSQGDCNGDGVVNITDLSILLSHWG